MNPETTPKTSSFSRSAMEWAKTIVIALVIAIPIRIFVAEPFIVSGASMDPTFGSGQFLVVDRLTYRFEQPQRGDVIIFEYPNNPSIYYIKRIIGLPGEIVKINDGKVTVIIKSMNCDGSSDTATSSCGIKLDDSYVDPSHISHDVFTTTLNDTEYFVMGDNRAQSSDSRAWGPLDQKFIVGRPAIRLFPFDMISILPGAHKE